LEDVMKTLRFAVAVRAPRETVWDTMLAPETYKRWTAEFTEGSYYEGTFAEGARIRFLAPDGNGITSVVAECRPHEFLSLKHLGYVKDGVEDTDSEAVRSWAPSFENYTFSEAGPSTKVTVDLDVEPAFEEYMTKVWPKALASLRALCEARATAAS
jgi:uncharacterized protein YndB with AHSA1/START domain